MSHPLHFSLMHKRTAQWTVVMINDNKIPAPSADFYLSSLQTFILLLASSVLGSENSRSKVVDSKVSREKSVFSGL